MAAHNLWMRSHQHYVYYEMSFELTNCASIISMPRLQALKCVTTQALVLNWLIIVKHIR